MNFQYTRAPTHVSSLAHSFARATIDFLFRPGAPLLSSLLLFAPFRSAPLGINSRLTFAAATAAEDVLLRENRGVQQEEQGRGGQEARVKRDEGGWPFVPTFYLLERRRYYAIDGNATLHTCTRTKKLLEGTRKRGLRDGMWGKKGEPRGKGIDLARLRVRSICHVCAHAT